MTEEDLKEAENACARVVKAFEGIEMSQCMPNSYRLASIVVPELIADVRKLRREYDHQVELSVTADEKLRELLRAAFNHMSRAQRPDKKLLEMIDEVLKDGP